MRAVWKLWRDQCIWFRKHGCDSVVRRVAGKRVERIGSAEDEEAVKDKVWPTNNEIEGWVCLRWELWVPGSRDVGRYHRNGQGDERSILALVYRRARLSPITAASRSHRHTRLLDRLRRCSHASWLCREETGCRGRMGTPMVQTKVSNWLLSACTCKRRTNQTLSACNGRWS